MIDDQTPQTPAYNLRKRQTKPTTSTAKSSKPAKTKGPSQPKKKAANYESDYDPESASESSEASVEEYNSEEEEFKTDLKRAKRTKAATPSTAATAATTTAQSTKRANKPKIDNAPIHIDLGEDEVRNIEEFHKKIVTPFWLLPDQMMDKNKRMMHEEGYDPTSVFIPEREFKRLSGLQQRYWDIKKNHFDQMVLFKFGVFYYIYHNDALIAHRLLDLRLNVWGKRFSVFFHETHLKKYATRLVEQGHKVAVVEQMENSHTKEDEYAKREVVQVLTRGTFSEGVDQGYSPRFCLCLFEIGQNYGIVFLDTTTHEFYIGEFQEDIHKGTLKTLLTRLKPMEIVYLHGNLSEETLAICKSLSSRPTMNPIHNKETLGLDIIIAKIEKYFQEEFPEVLDNIRIVAQTGMDSIKKLRKKEQRQTAEQKIIFYPTLQALSLCMTFLERIMLAETVFKMGNFLRYDIAVEKKSTLYLDSQALESLEIFEVGYLTSSNSNNNNTGSLFDYMDKTVTDFGKRMLRRWMMTPLLDPVKISERLDAVDDLLHNPEELDLIQSCLKRLPDIERSVNKVYNLSNKKRMSAVYFEDFAKNRLKDFLFFLEELEKIDDMIKGFQGSLSKFHSKRLKQLITFKPSEKKKVSLKKKAAATPKRNDDGAEIMEILSSKEEESNSVNTSTTGVFPSISPLIKELKEMVQIVDGLPMPAEGTNEETDKIMKEIKKVKTRLASILDHERRYYGFKAVNYVHTKYRYELEIPEAIVKASKRPENYVITSKRQGFLRFHTPSIEECIQELEEHERELQKVLVDFIVGYFKKFYDHNLIWRQVVTCLGELDCISGLARLATTMNVRCRPNVLSQPGEGEKSVFVLKDMVHPSLAAQMEREAKLEELSKAKTEQAVDGEQNQAKKKKKKAQATQPVTQVSQAPIQNPNPTMEIQERFVRNDVVKEDGMDIFLITGPNMGGKSTLLRQTALAVIMAQMGSMVPAKEFTFNVVDRVFTRIGAGDKIFEGKSTFFLEMEETSNIVKEATRHSLLVMDELGRGTSTYDGVSLAYATLKYVSEQIKCLTLFATHYHILLEEFQLYKNVKKYFMLSYYNEQTEDLKFTYKFIEGSAERSHSYVIAKMAGLPKETLVIAKERAAMMTKEKENMDRASQIEKNFNKAILTLKSFKKDKEGVKSSEDVLSILEGLTA